ncbi:MAG TPA: type II toxin-antitoxin system prevent-host-death family antitoxin [Acidobacteriaceae bacterium]
MTVQRMCANGYKSFMHLVAAESGAGTMGPDFVYLAKLFGYNCAMEITTGEAKNQLSKLIRAAERGETVVITRHGKPVAQITPATPRERSVRLGGMKGRIRLLPGWDAPVETDELLGDRR